MKLFRLIAGLALSCSLLTPVFAQQAADSSGEAVFNEQCAACHVEIADDKIPRVETLQQMNANAILRTLTEGAMRLQGNLLSEQQRISVAEFISGTAIINQPVNFTQGMCSELPPVTRPEASGIWSGWGRDEGNTRFTSDTGGINKQNIKQLTLKWVFGIPDVSSVRSQPAVYGDHLYVGSQNGVVFALNTDSGCTYWSYKTEGGIRNAISVEQIDIAGETRTAVFFSDLLSFAYAVDAETGEEIWKVKVGVHSAAMGTASLQYHQGVVYVPLSGLSEEALAGGDNDYPCCSFRGSVTALNAATGEQIWKTFTLPEPAYVRTFADGKELIGPAGAAVWNTPSIDSKRGLIYIATGNAYVEPPQPTSNALLALDLQSGDIVWATQVLAEDIWSGGCSPDFGGDPGSERCWDPVGPDFDFSASPVLTTMSNGKDIIVATQKSGLGFAFDPDDAGRQLWTYRWGVGAAPGGVYGTASDGERAYFAVADQRTPKPGGMHAVDLESGERVWFTPPADLLCRPGPGCGAAQSAAVTVIPGLVLSGSMDGGLRAYDAETGDIVWTYNANQQYDTVNGITANGGSLDGAGPVIVDGMLFVTAGNGGPFGSPGNVLLAFSLE